MRTIISTALLLLLSSAVNADGFYQAVVGNAPQSSQQINSEIAETHYTPLYDQVTASLKYLAAKETVGPSGDFTYTPLYLQVLGPERSWSVTDKIAQTDIN